MRQFGNIMTQLQAGSQTPNRHTNPYLLKTLEFDGILISPKESLCFKDQEHHQPLIIEIGSYLGKTLCEMAQTNSHIKFLGLDITYKRVVKTANKIKKNGLCNAQVALCGAQEFIESMPDNSVDGICIFFPDPWEKRKQKKNRLLNESFSSLMVKKLKSGGFIWFKSDHQDYFNQAQSYLLQAGLYKHQFDDQPSLLTGGPFKTAFEELFLSKNIPYKNILVYKE